LDNTSAEKSPIGRLWQSTGNLLFRPKDDHEAKQDRSIRFNTSVKVVLIPAREDYERAELSRALWWGEHDYECFKTDAVNELKATMVAYHLSGRDASIVLYQGLEADRNAPPKTPSFRLEERAEEVLVALRELVAIKGQDKSAPIEIVVPVGEVLEQKMGNILPEALKCASSDRIEDAAAPATVQLKPAHTLLPDRSANTGPRFEGDSREIQGAACIDGTVDGTVDVDVDVDVGCGGCVSASFSYPNARERVTQTAALIRHPDYKYDQFARKIVVANGRRSSDNTEKNSCIPNIDDGNSLSTTSVTSQKFAVQGS
jgi:hypothetical protein